jgi:hypothetical protein
MFDGYPSCLLSVADNNGPNDRVFNFRVGFCNRHGTSLIEGLCSFKAIRPVHRHASNSGHNLSGDAADRADHKEYRESEAQFLNAHFLISKLKSRRKTERPFS